MSSTNNVNIKLTQIENRFSRFSNKKEMVFEGNTKEEVFEKIYNYKRTYRYCDTGFEFPNKQDSEDYTNWYNSLSKAAQFDLYYGSGIVD